MTGHMTEHMDDETMTENSIPDRTETWDVVVVGGGAAGVRMGFYGVTMGTTL